MTVIINSSAVYNMVFKSEKRDFFFIHQLVTAREWCRISGRRQQVADIYLPKMNEVFHVPNLMMSGFNNDIGNV